MKAETSGPKRYLQDGVVIYSSNTLHHQKTSIRGFMYKRSERRNFFGEYTFHKRYFIAQGKGSSILIQEQQISKHFKRIERADIVCIDNVGKDDKLGQDFKYRFKLKTKGREYHFCQINEEERDLWINALHRLMDIPVADTNFKLAPIYQKVIAFNSQVMMTEGNDVNSSFQKQKDSGPNSAKSNSNQHLNSQQQVSTFKPSNTHVQAFTLPPQSPQQKMALGVEANLDVQTRQQSLELQNRTPQKFQGSNSQKQSESPDQEAGYTDRTDELKTINLIESLEPDAKRILNALVQSVLATQKENECDKLQIIAQKRKMVQAEQQLQKSKLDYQKQKFELIKLEQKTESSRQVVRQNQSQPLRSDPSTRVNVHDATQRPNSEQKQRKNKIVSIKRYKVTKDGIRTEVPLTPLAISDGFTFHTTEKRQVMTPTGKQQTITVRLISKPRQISTKFDFDSKHLETNSFGGMTIVQPLELQQLGDIGIVPAAPQNYQRPFRVDFQAQNSYLDRVSKFQ